MTKLLKKLVRAAVKIGERNTDRRSSIIWSNIDGISNLAAVTATVVDHLHGTAPFLNSLQAYKSYTVPYRPLRHYVIMSLCASSAVRDRLGSDRKRHLAMKQMETLFRNTSLNATSYQVQRLFN